MSNQDRKWLSSETKMAPPVDPVPEVTLGAGELDSALLTPLRATTGQTVPLASMVQGVDIPFTGQCPWGFRRESWRVTE